MDKHDDAILPSLLQALETTVVRTQRQSRIISVQVKCLSNCILHFQNLVYDEALASVNRTLETFDQRSRVLSSVCVGVTALHRSLQRNDWVVDQNLQPIRIRGSWSKSAFVGCFLRNNSLRSGNCRLISAGREKQCYSVVLMTA